MLEFCFVRGQTRNTQWHGSVRCSILHRARANPNYPHGSIGCSILALCKDSCKIPSDTEVFDARFLHCARANPKIPSDTEVFDVRFSHAAKTNVKYPVTRKCSMLDFCTVQGGIRSTQWHGTVRCSILHREMEKPKYPRTRKRSMLNFPLWNGKSKMPYDTEVFDARFLHCARQIKTKMPSDTEVFDARFCIVQGQTQITHTEILDARFWHCARTAAKYPVTRKCSMFDFRMLQRQM